MVALCAALALTSGCSAVRLGYASAPDLVYWWLDSHADFNEAQVPRVREALAQWFAWHRRTQLPDYAAQLARVQAEFAADTSAARACEWQGEVLARARSAFERASPAVAELMLTITPQQIVHIERRHAKANSEYRDEYLQADARKRAQKIRTRAIDRAETIYGKLDEGQRAHIGDALARSPFEPQAWFDERRQRQQEWVAMLRRLTSEAASREQALAALKDYVARIERSSREGYRRYAQRVAEFNCAFAADLHNRTDAAQRRTAAQRLAGWEGDLRALALAAEPSPN